MENSGTALAIRGKDGVVFAVEKIVTSKLYEKGANRRIFNIDTHIGMATAGLVTDARQLASIARDEVGKHMAYGYMVTIIIVSVAGQQLSSRLRLLSSHLRADQESVRLHARLHSLLLLQTIRSDRHAGQLDSGQ